MLKMVGEISDAVDVLEIDGGNKKNLNQDDDDQWPMNKNDESTRAQ